MTEARVVLMTAPDVGQAKVIARALVEERLCACVNIVPGVTSVYRWEGALHEDAELLLVAKTTAARVDALRARVIALHPYAVPEVVALPITAGSAPYLDWLGSEVRNG